MAPLRPPRLDITRLRLKNFKSIARCDVSLGPLTLLVGPNGSGKSNVLDALRLTADGLNTSLDHALRERGGVDQVRRRSGGHPTHFTVHLDLQTPTATGSYTFEVGASKGGGFSVNKEEISFTSSEFGSEQLVVRIRDGAVFQASPSLGLLPKPDKSQLYLVRLSGVEQLRSLYDGLSHMQVFNLSPELMKKPQTPDVGDLLHRNGNNIASVLERLESPAMERVVDYLQTIVQGVRSVKRVSLGSWESLEFRQVVEGQSNAWTFPAESMSDGTLRALGVLVALFASTPESASPIGIEEPETALHPAAAATLMGALRDASESRQVVVTSHSPDLLDMGQVTQDELLAVRSSEGTTRIARLDAAGRMALGEELFGAGELLRQDQLQPAAGEQLELSL